MKIHQGLYVAERPRISLWILTILFMLSLAATNAYLGVTALQGGRAVVAAAHFITGTLVLLAAALMVRPVLLLHKTFRMYETLRAEHGYAFLYFGDPEISRKRACAACVEWSPVEITAEGQRRSWGACETMSDPQQGFRKLTHPDFYCAAFRRKQDPPRDPSEAPGRAVN